MNMISNNNQNKNEIFDYQSKVESVDKSLISGKNLKLFSVSEDSSNTKFKPENINSKQRKSFMNNNFKTKLSFKKTTGDFDLVRRVKKIFFLNLINKNYLKFREL